jgi:uncharacterized protein YndB with AHSA1/START domain
MNPDKTQLVAEIFIKAPTEKVWDLWTKPEHIVNWNNISDEWHTPRAENDLRVGGRLFLRMEKKDNSGGFDYECFSMRSLTIRRSAIPDPIIEKQPYRFLLRKTG